MNKEESFLKLSARWPGGACRGESQPLSLMWGGESQNLIKPTFHKSAAHEFFDYKHRAWQGEGGEKKKGVK